MKKETLIPQKEEMERLRDSIVVPPEAEPFFLIEGDFISEDILKQLREADWVSKFRQDAARIKKIGYPGPTPRHLLGARLLQTVADSLNSESIKAHKRKDDISFVLYHDMSQGVYFVILQITSADSVLRKRITDKFQEEAEKLKEDPSGFSLVDHAIEVLKRNSPDGALELKGAELARTAYKVFFPLTADN